MERRVVNMGKGKRTLRKRRIILTVFAVIFIGLMVFVIKESIGFLTGSRNNEVIPIDEITMPKWVDEQIINVNGLARRGELLDSIKDIVVHYVGNPKSTAQQNRDYFNNPVVEVSSHFVVGLEGEVIQCVPLDEKSSASNWRNNDTISIEVCHPDETGKFTKKTYNSLVRLTAWLRDQYDLDKKNIIRHYDITEKQCPIYYVKNEDAWEQFKKDVMKYDTKEFKK